MKKLIIRIAVIVAVVVTILIQGYVIVRLSDKNTRLHSNTKSLVSTIHQYKVSDSLNAAKVYDLTLKVSEYERYRSRDLQLIEELEVKNRKLHQVLTTNTETINQLKGTVRDTTIYIVETDTVFIESQKIEVNQPWVQLEGILDRGEFIGSVRTVDSLLITEQVTYKRFLGFLWKTKRVKEREFDVVSRNPNTVIQDFEVITLEK